jgi:hypothetical protein
MAVNREKIKTNLFNLLRDFEELVDTRCGDNCDGCFFDGIILPKREEPYTYAAGTLYGPLTVCDLLNIMLAVRCMVSWEGEI